MQRCETVSQWALAVDLKDFLDALKIEKPILAGFDWGARTANIFAALWPERSKATVSVSGYLIGNQEAGVLLPPRCGMHMVLTAPCTHAVTFCSLKKPRD